nr:hypothetical protein [Tanacetum cinerariifolium]
MGDENLPCTIGDYSLLSYEGYRNTIELPDGKNVMPLRSDTFRWCKTDVHSRDSGPKIQINILRIFQNLWTHLTLMLKIAQCLDENKECFFVGGLVKGLLGIGGGICSTVRSRYMTGTVAVKVIGLYSLWCLRIETTSFKNVSMMFESKATCWLLFVILSLLALGTNCSSDTIAA